MRNKQPKMMSSDDLAIPAGSNMRRPNMAIAVDPVALVISECLTVTSAMRKNARWAQSSVASILGGSPATYTYGENRLSRSRRSDSLSAKSSTNENWTPKGSLNEDEAPTSRWGLRGKKGKSLLDNPLVSAFTKLRNELKNCRDIQSFDVPTLLHPFLQVIRSSSTSAPITSLALIAITKFFSYDLISAESPRLSLGMQLLSAAVTHCRFEASDSAADEIVLLRILKLMEQMLSAPGGDLLGDESVCEMMETGLSMCCQGRLSEFLRRSAEISMTSMCQMVFERLKLLEASDGGELALQDGIENGADVHLRLDPPSEATGATTTGSSITANSMASEDKPVSGEGESREKPNQGVNPTLLSPHNGSSSATDPDESGPVSGQDKNASVDPLVPVDPSEEQPPEIKPYSMPSIRELLRVLINLLDPYDRQHNDNMRVMALRMIDVALEVAGPSIARHPSLASLVKDILCKNLLQLVRSDNMSLLNESLRVAGTLLAACRSVLKLQQELFLSYLVACLHPRMEIPQESGIPALFYEHIPQTPKLVKPPPSASQSGRSTPVPVKDRQKLGLEGGTRKPDAREAMVEGIGALVRIPSFLAELYINYDCEVDRADLCEDLVGLLCRNSFPDSATWSTTNVPPLCLDSLLTYVNSLASRLPLEPDSGDQPEKRKLREQRVLKKTIVKGSTKFNENPKHGIEFLASQGVIKDPNNGDSVARFLKGTSRVSKKVLGEYLSKKSNEKFLRAFMDLFDFKGQRVDEALRDLLGSFRLPGESPLIERIVTVFSEKYCLTSGQTDIVDKDGVFVLTYAIIMLNTELYNRNIKTQNRMSLEAFAKNLRGVNGGRDFAPGYLQEIYESIKTNEIILPDEHDNQQAFNYAWAELLSKASTSGNLIPCDDNTFDSEVFGSTWKAVVSTLSYVFMSATEDAVFQRVIAGFDQCAQVASRYGLTECLDHIIYCLSIISTLSADEPLNTSLNTQVQAHQRNVMVSELAVRFGRDYRAQLATVVLFKGVVAGNEFSVRDGWKHVIRIWLNLFTNSLIPAGFEDFSTSLDLPPIPIQTTSQVVNREEKTNGTGLLQSFTSYLSSYAADDPPEPSDEELSDTLCTYDCLGVCPLEEILSKIRQLPPEASNALVTALLDQLPEDTLPVIAVIKPETGHPETGKADNGKQLVKGYYSPSIIYILEMASAIAAYSEDESGMIAKGVQEALLDVLRNARDQHPLVISRVASYLLFLLKVKYDLPFIRVPVILHNIASLDGKALEKSALPILKGLSRCLGGSRNLRSEMINIPDFWSTLRGFHGIEEVAGEVFELLHGIMADCPSAVTADNYESCILLLNDFASAGSVGALYQQTRDRHSRRSQQLKPSNPSEQARVQRGAKSVEMIFQLTSRVPSLIDKSHLERKEAWTAYWSPIFRALTTQCINPCREIRQQAFAGLQSALLSPELASPDHLEWTAIFGEVLFPLILRLLKPEIFHTDPIGMSDTRVQAATLLCKIFLHYLVILSEYDGMLELWLKILNIMDRLMNSGQGDSLEEAVPESLKNVLLVMASGGFLVEGSDDAQKRHFWDATWKRLEKFLPGMRAELFPEPSPNLNPDPNPNPPVTADPATTS